MSMLKNRLLHLQSVREFELAQVARRLPATGSVLEVGAGAGWQAKVLTDLGYFVAAVDIPGTRYRKYAQFPVVPYDGKNLPFADAVFDVVFSSNVLEHVIEYAALDREIQRVLKPEGYAVHVLPTPSWRIFTILTHHAYLIQLASVHLARLERPQTESAAIDEVAFEKKPFKLQQLFGLLLPRRHGEQGSVFSEIYLFSKFRWTRLFIQSGWGTVERIPLRLAYSGNQVFHSRFSLRLRKWGSLLVGSSTAIYVLKKQQAREPGCTGPCSNLTT